MPVPRDQTSHELMPQRRSWTRRRVLVGVAGLLLGAGAIVFGLVIPRLEPRAAVATGYMARVACACYFIGGRSLEGCTTDKEPGMELVVLSKDEKARRIFARVPLISSASATHTAGLGCVLDAK